MHIHANLYTHIWKFLHTHTNMYTHICKLIHTYTHTDTYKWVHVHMQMCTNTHAPMCTHEMGKEKKIQDLNLGFPQLCTHNPSRPRRSVHPCMSHCGDEIRTQTALSPSDSPPFFRDPPVERCMINRHEWFQELGISSENYFPQTPKALTFAPRVREYPLTLTRAI